MRHRCFVGYRRAWPQGYPEHAASMNMRWWRSRTHRITGAGCGPTAVSLNGADLPFSRGANPYRMGAAEVPMEAVLARLIEGVNRLRIQVG